MTKRIIKDVSVTGKIPRQKIVSVISAVHVAPSSGAWQVRKAGKDRITESFSSKQAAIKFAHSVSTERGVDLIVHDNGTAKTVNSSKSSSKNSGPVK